MQNINQEGKHVEHVRQLLGSLCTALTAAKNDGVVIGFNIDGSGETFKLTALTVQPTPRSVL